MTAFVHIGMEKAGSTALQSWLAAGRGRHSEWVYPALPLDNHYLLPLAVVGEPMRPTLENALGMSQSDALAHVRQELGSITERPLVLSCELLSSWLTGEDVQRFRELLTDYDSDIRIVYVVRRLDCAVLSRVSEAARHGGTSLDFLQTAASDHLRHGDVVERWTSVFGPGSVSVIPFYEDWTEDDHIVHWVLKEINLGQAQLATVGLPHGRSSPRSESVLSLVRLNQIAESAGVELSVSLREEILEQWRRDDTSDPLAVPEAERALLRAQSQRVESALLDRLAREFDRDRFDTAERQGRVPTGERMGRTPDDSVLTELLLNAVCHQDEIEGSISPHVDEKA